MKIFHIYMNIYIYINDKLEKLNKTEYLASSGCNVVNAIFLPQKTKIREKLLLIMHLISWGIQNIMKCTKTQDKLKSKHTKKCVLNFIRLMQK